MIFFGITNAVAAFATGSIVRLTGRKSVMIFAFCLHMGIFIFMLRWRPTPDQGTVFFLVSSLWGVCDSIWLVQINGTYKPLRPNKLITYKNSPAKNRLPLENLHTRYDKLHTTSSSVLHYYCTSLTITKFYHIMITP